MSQPTDELIALAQDPSAPLETLHQLAQNYPELRPYIATNPRTYPALLEWLATLEDPAVNAALASRSSGGTTGESTQVLPSSPSAAEPSDAATGVLPSSGTQTPPTSQVTHTTQMAQAPQWAAGHTVARTVGGPAPDPADATQAMGAQGAAPTSSAASAASATQAVSAASAAAAPSVLPPQSYTQAIPAQPGAGTALPSQPLPQSPASPYQQAASAPSALPPAAGPAVDPAAGASTQVVGAAPQGGEQTRWPSVPPAQVNATYPGQPTPPRQPTTPVRRSTQVASGAAAYAAAGRAGAGQSGLPQPAAQGAGGTVFGVGSEDTASASPSGRFLWILAAAVAALVVFVATWYLTGNNNDSSADQGAAPSPSTQQQASSQDDSSPSAQDTPSASPTPSATPSQELRAPAPDDALELSTFTSPSGNITCVLSDDSVSCTIDDYDFVGNDSSCTSSSTPFTATVGNSGKATGSCGQAFSPSGASLQYGYSAKNETFACTSDSSGIECWSQVTGEGFSLSRGSSNETHR